MKSSRLRGRPIEPELQEQRKRQLIDAAFELLAEKGYRSISIRELAEKAGTQSAMVSYYFGSKEGLFLALLEQIASQNIVQLQSALQADNPLLAFIKTLLNILLTHPQLHRFLIDEVLSAEGPFKTTLIDLFPRRMATQLPAVLKAQQQRGLIRKDLDPKWLAFSFSSLIVFPFIVKPVRELAWQISDADLASDEWAQHLYQLFMAGAQGASA